MLIAVALGRAAAQRPMHIDFHLAIDGRKLDWGRAVNLVVLRW
jgi:hypothetical protein